YTGTIVVIIKAKVKGIILTIKPLLAKIKQADFRITDEIERQALQEAGE
ncbi:MAG: putative nucleic acid-binding protein contains domain, partial [Segetibacter sp.]|nr:putative nucleic acid-binding protein contains domain [Segetibacter sp.]